MDRRRFLGGLAAIGAVTACSSDDGETDRSGTPDVSRTTPVTAAQPAEVALPAGVFGLGVASGDPLADRVVLWTRLAPTPEVVGGASPDIDVEVAYDVATDERFERRGSYVVSSIGSIPEPIPGLPTKGELIAFDDWDLGRIAAFPTLFGAGNVVTGKGNIVASRKHAAHVSEAVATAWLGLGPGGHAGEERALEGAAAAARAAADGVAAALRPVAPPPAATIEALLVRVRARQRDVGFSGSATDWIRAHTPPDPEQSK